MKALPGPAVNDAWCLSVAAKKPCSWCPKDWGMQAMLP
jgi:hypothetical protein